MPALRLWRDDTWQHSVLFCALAAMEISWLTPLVMSLHARSWGVWPGWYWLGLAAIMAGLITVAHVLAGRELASPVFELTTLAVIIVFALIILRFYIFWGEPWLSLDWLAALFNPASMARQCQLTHGPCWPDVLLTLVVLAYMWWRAVAFLQREIGFFVIGYDFRRGVLALALSVSLFTVLVEQEVQGRGASIFVYVFFFFSLLAVAVGRAADKASTSADAGRPLGPEWAPIIALAILVVLGAALLASRWWSLAGFRSLAALTAPFTAWVGSVLALLLLYVLRLLEPFLVQFIETLRNAWLANGGEGPGITLPSVLIDATQNLDPTAATWPGWLSFIIDTLLPALGFVIFLLVLALWLQRRGKRRLQPGGLEDTEAAAARERQELGRLWRDNARRLRQLMARVGSLALGRRLYAAISVRHIYANVQRLARSRGYPRSPAQTPNDYLPALIHAFPGQEEALRRITSLYNAVEYGHLPTSAEEWQHLHADWAAVREAGRSGDRETSRKVEK